MAYIIARIEIEPEERFPAEGDSVYLCREVDLRTDEGQYVGQLRPYEDERGRQLLWGYLDEHDLLRRYAMGIGEVVPLKKIAYRHSRIDSYAKLMRVEIPASVTKTLERIHHEVPLEDA